MWVLGAKWTGTAAELLCYHFNSQMNGSNVNISARSVSESGIWHSNDTTNNDMSLRLSSLDPSEPRAAKGTMHNVLEILGRWTLNLAYRLPNLQQKENQMR